MVIPTAYGRDGDTLYLHGSTGAGNMRAALAADISVAVTLVDGIVYARSAMHFSMNYRSAVMHGRAAEVTDPDQRLHALKVMVEHPPRVRGTGSDGRTRRNWPPPSSSPSTSPKPR